MEETDTTVNSEEVVDAAEAGANSLLNTSMTPDDIIEAYKVLAQNVQDNTAQEAARIGNAQRSLGTLAARVASPSGQTSGLANYTYDRTMRPTVDSTSKALITQGLATGLQTNLSNALRAAKNRYEDARNRATANSGGGGGTTGGNNGDDTEEVTDPAYTGVPLTDENYTVRDFLNLQHERGEISDEDYEAAINALVDGDGGSYKPSSSHQAADGTWYWSGDGKRHYWSGSQEELLYMSEQYQQGKISAEAYEEYLKQSRGIY